MLYLIINHRLYYYVNKITLVLFKYQACNIGLNRILKIIMKKFYVLLNRFWFSFRAYHMFLNSFFCRPHFKVADMLIILIIMPDLNFINIPIGTKLLRTVDDVS